MSERFTYSSGPDEYATRPRQTNCFGCGRRIREWESGVIDTGLCEDCQSEAEEQAARDNAAGQEGDDDATDA